MTNIGRYLLLTVGSTVATLRNPYLIILFSEKMLAFSKQFLFSNMFLKKKIW
jgi:hypothetical protein